MALCRIVAFEHLIQPVEILRAVADILKVDHRLQAVPGHVRDRSGQVCHPAFQRPIGRQQTLGTGGLCARLPVVLLSRFPGLSTLHRVHGSGKGGKAFRDAASRRLDGRFKGIA